MEDTEIFKQIQIIVHDLRNELTKQNLKMRRLSKGYDNLANDEIYLGLKQISEKMTEQLNAISNLYKDKI